MGITEGEEAMQNWDYWSITITLGEMKRNNAVWMTVLRQTANDGWEPFFVTPITNANGATEAIMYHLRRLLEE